MVPFACRWPDDFSENQLPTHDQLLLGVDSPSQAKSVKLKLGDQRVEIEPAWTAALPCKLTKVALGVVSQAVDYDKHRMFPGLLSQ
jgi:hypothetical protein